MVTPALAACLLSGATDVPAQSKDQSTSSQVDQQAREQAKDSLDQAKSALKQGDLAGARTLLEKARASDPEVSGLADLESDLAKAVAKAAEGQAVDSAAANKEAVASLLQTAEAQLDGGQFGRARETVTKILQLDPENRKAPRLLEKVRKAELRAQQDAAAAQIERDLEAANRLVEIGRFQEAQAAYRAILEQSPKNRQAQKGLASAEEGLAKSVTTAASEAATDVAAKAVEAPKVVAEPTVQVVEVEVISTPAVVAEAVKAVEAAATATSSPLPTPGLATATRTNTPEENDAVRRVEEDARRRAAERLAGGSSSAAAISAPAVRNVPVEITPVPTEAPVVVEIDVTPIPVEVTSTPTPEPTETPAPTATPEPTDTPAPTATPEQAVEAAAPVTTPEPMTEAPFTEATPTPAPTPEEVTAVVAKPTSAPSSEMTEVKQVDTGLAEANEEARKAEEKALAESAKQAQLERENVEKSQGQQDALRRNQAERAYEEGVALYEKGELARARQRWNDAKEIDPSYLKPDSYLQNTEAEYNAYLANKTSKDDFEAREAAALEKMNTLIPFSTQEPLALAEFLRTLRLLSDIDFVVAGQVDAKVDAAFEDEPLHAVLDSVLHPIGLRWERKPGTDTIIITPDLRTEVFPVLPETLSTIDSLLKQGVINRLLYGPQGTVVLQGQEIMTDPRQNVVIVTDSEQNLQKFRGFLDGLKGTNSAQLIFKSFEIDEKKAPQVKALLDAILKVDDKAPYNTERKLILEGSTLIIKDSPENVQKVEQILQDEKFLARFYDNTLDVATFNLTPVLAFENNPDLSHSFADQVRQVVETLLYAQEGRQKAESEGRRVFYDAATMQLTIVDYPDRLEAVQNYVQSLPQIRSKRRSKIIFLDWATAADLVTQIQSFTGTQNSGNKVQATGTEVTKSMRTEDELSFHGATIRMLRVNENDVSDENDDSVELYVRTGTENQETTIEEFRSEFVDDFEIVAEDVKPSNTPGEGRARLKIRYVPGGQGGNGTTDTTTTDGTLGGAAGGTLPTDANSTASDGASQTASDQAFNMVEIENLNAIFVEYDNIEDLREVEFWVKTLDIPTLQVSIEIKFVEVVTNKAKALKSALNFGDLTGDMSLSDSVLRNRFGQDRDEYGSPFETNPEDANTANLLKGTTVFDFIVNNGSSPISIELRMLEAQGVINVVNGPTVTVTNNESAEFTIAREFGVRTPVAGSTSSGSSDAQLSAVGSITPVDMSVTPIVTRAGNITLTIDIEMNDLDQNTGQIAALTPTTTGGTTTATGAQPYAVNNLGGFTVLRKELTTEARIKDGGTVVLGGWRNERTDEQESGVPVLRDIPYIGKLLFSRFSKDEDKITLLIFLTGQVVRD